ncbi:MAG TPA: hypothetical protein VM598_11645, partial [Bdellovibrionota bacterium]|nr:hypothetical protein [Bdellovibrionota bacterium]
LDRLFGLVISLSSRRFDRSDRVVIKPRSSCNAIMTDLLGARPPARGIFTYCSLPEFLVLVLKDEGRRQAIDMDARARAVESRAFPALSGLDPASLSDAKKGAFIWLLDVYHYLRALETECGPRLRSLEANTFLRAPAESLAAIARHFEVPLTLARAREIVSSSVFSSYSKNTEIKYDRESRAKDLARLAQLHKPEVDEAVEWAAEVTRDAPIPGRLHQPLEVPSK